MRGLLNGSKEDGGKSAVYLSTFQARSPSLNRFTYPITTQHTAGNEMRTHTSTVASSAAHLQTIRQATILLMTLCNYHVTSAYACSN